MRQTIENSMREIKDKSSILNPLQYNNIKLTTGIQEYKDDEYDFIPYNLKRDSLGDLFVT
jgi:hypothetical protein